MSIETESKEIERIEKIVRCDGEYKGTVCGRFLTKVVFILSISPELRKKGVGITDIIPGMEVKIGTETKCHKCKKIYSNLTVL